MPPKSVVSDVEVGTADTDLKPLLSKEAAALVEESEAFVGVHKGLAQRFFARLFFAKFNPDFANDAELAVRSAFFAVILGLPFLIPSENIPALDFLMSNGMYTNGVVIFFVFHLNKTLGQVLEGLFSGFKGAFAAVLSGWALYFVFPDGVTEDGPAYVWWCGIGYGVFFIFMLLWLNFGVSTQIFCISNFVFSWMAFLKPGEDHNHAPFTEPFTPIGNKGVNCLITVAVGSVLATMVTLMPYPRLAMRCAKDTGKDLVHQLPVLWHTLATYLSEPAPNSYIGDQFHRRLHRLSRVVHTVEGHIDNAWWESFGRPLNTSTRRVLRALDKSVHESYDRLYSTFTVASTEQWSEIHEPFMAKINGPVAALIKEIEVLLHVAFNSGFDGVLSDVEAAALEKTIKNVKAAEDAFSSAFRAARSEQVPGDSEKATFQIMELLQVECMFALNISAFARMSTSWAEDIIKAKTNPEHFPSLTEPVSISVLWDPAVIYDKMHLNWVFRACLSIFTGFAAGYIGYKDVYKPYDASIACTISVMLSKFIGSQLVKDLGRIQGVVLGTVVGQLTHAFWNTCTWWSVTGLGLSVFFFNALALFTYNNSTQYSYLACLLVAFGTGQMLSGGCGMLELDKEGSYDTITSTVAAITIMLGYDISFSPGRASAFASQKMADVIEQLDKAMSSHLDKTSKDTTWMKGDIMKAITDAESMGDEANQEPRYWRIAWPMSVYMQATKEAYKIRYNLAAMEYCIVETSKDAQDKKMKSSVLMTLLQTEHFGKLTDLVKAKVKAVRPLVQFFGHETVERFEGHTAPESLKRFRDEVQAAQQAVMKEIISVDANDKTFNIKTSSGPLEDEPLCQVITIIGSLKSMMTGLRNFQHTILRAD